MNYTVSRIATMLAVTFFLFFSGCVPEDGEVGPAGEDGRNGTNGADGIDGQNGADGQDGTDGQNGADGQDGADGADGADGQDGTLEFFFADFDDSIIPSEFDQSTDDNADWGLWYIDFTIGAKDFSSNISFGSNDISDSEFSSVSLPFTNDLPVLVEFDIIISTEECCDYVKWYMNGSVVNGLAGDGGPYHIAFEVPPGSNTLMFEYVKDGSISQLNDNGWIDNLTVTNITSVGRYNTSLPELGEDANYWSDRVASGK